MLRAGLLSGGGGGILPNFGTLVAGAVQIIVGFATGGGIPPLSQAVPFNLGSLASVSATSSTSNNQVVTGLADSMLSHLQNNQQSVVRPPTMHIICWAAHASTSRCMTCQESKQAAC